jgi:hypothetical protein
MEQIRTPSSVVVLQQNWIPILRLVGERRERLQEVKVERSVCYSALMHHAAAIPAGVLSGRRVQFPFLILSLAAAAENQNRGAGFWFLCVPGLEAIANAMSWLIAKQ